jgi:hypothetical protein
MGHILGLLPLLQLLIKPLFVSDPVDLDPFFLHLQFQGVQLTERRFQQFGFVVVGFQKRVDGRLRGEELDVVQREERKKTLDRGFLRQKYVEFF